jgi:3-oxoacyl-[acyl-carrier protein] reductase
MFDLTGKRALVTGASGAKVLAGAGAKVAISGTRVAALDEVAAEIGGAVVLPCNLSDLAAVDKLVPSAEAVLGGVDILVNNAGITRDNLFMRMKDEEWDEVIAVNLTAVFRLTRAALRGMMRQRYGRIVNISSLTGVAGNPGQGNYAASKAGLIGMGKSLAQEVASRNITVNAIAPGFITSAMTAELNDRQMEAILPKIPVGRLGTPVEIAAAALFLASTEASYITGQTLNVNGGMAML